MKNDLFLIFGPSGGGKSSIVNVVSKNRAVTTTSRTPGNNETNGLDYYFVPNKTFEEMINHNEFIEWAKYGKEDQKKYYGLTKTEFYKRLEMDDLFIICDIQGVQKYKNLFPNAIAVFIYSTLENVQKQLSTRGRNDRELEDRLGLYYEEMKNDKYADWIIENKHNQLDESIQIFKNKIQELKRSRMI